MPVDAEHLALFQTLVPSFLHLKTTILFYEAKKDDNIMHFSGDLDQQVDKLRYQLFSLKNKVSGLNFRFKIGCIFCPFETESVLPRS